MVNIGPSQGLFDLELGEHALIEGETDVDAERVLREHRGSLAAHPLGGDVEHRAVVVAVDDGDAQAQRGRDLLGAVLAVDGEVGRGVADTRTVVEAAEETTVALAAAVVGAEDDLVAVLEQSALEPVAALVGILRVVEAAPFLQLVVGADHQLAVVAIDRSHAEGMGQVEGIGDTEVGRVGHGQLGVVLDDGELRVGVETVAQTVGQTQRDLVLGAEGLRVLQSEVELVAAHLGGVGALQRIDVGVAIRIGHVLRVATPEIGGVDADGEIAQRLRTHAEIDLVEALRTAILVVVGGRGRLGGEAAVDVGGVGVVVAHVGVGQQTEAHAHMAKQAKARHHILQVGIARADGAAALLELRHLQAHARVEDERQRVEGRVGGRVEGVDLVVEPEAIGQSVHAAAETARLFGEFAQAILAVGGVGAALRMESEGGEEQERCCYRFLH